MGDPNTGEIYRGMLRKEGDVPLNEEQAEWLKSLPVQDRMSKLQEMARKLQASGVEMVSESPEPPDPPRFSGVSRPMPLYKSHKEVWALKIKSIETVRPTVEELQRILDSNQESPAFDAAIITPEDDGYAPFGVSGSYMRKHEPKTGGYFVVYKDGYQSYSPAQAFEEGYTRI